MSSSDSSDSASSAQMWEVLEILAQRASSDGSTELLVVWKAEWILQCQIQPGPVLTTWQQTRRVRSEVYLDAANGSASAATVHRSRED